MNHPTPPDPSPARSELDEVVATCDAFEAAWNSGAPPNRRCPGHRGRGDPSAALPRTACPGARAAAEARRTPLARGLPSMRLFLNNGPQQS